MGFVGDMLGTQNKAKASSGAPIADTSQSYNQIKQRGDLQTGVNQEQVKFGQANLQNPFNAGSIQGTQGQIGNSMAQQQAFTNAMQAQGGLGNQSSVFGQQQSLANQLQQQAAGGGPNPALSQLSDATGNNIKNQAALMASQRGAGQNAGLLAKQAAEQGAATQQQAAGQAATMRAQQQLAAQQQLQAQQSQMGQLATQQVGQQAQGINTMGQLALGNQQQVLGMLASQNQANLAQQQGINQLNLAQAQGVNNINAGMAQQQNNIASQMAMQGNQLRAGASQANAQNSLAAQGINAQVAGQNAQSNASLAGGLLGAGGGVMAGMASGGTGLFAYKGGEIPQKYAGGGIAPWGGAPILDTNPNAFAQSSAANFGSIKAPGGKSKPASSLGQRNYSSTSDEDSYQVPIGLRHDLPAAPNMINQGVDTKKSWDPNTFGKSAGVNAAHGGSIGSKLKSGGGVPGKAKVKGDSLKNDNVKALLSPGEIVIPRSITQGQDAPRKAAEFVASILARKGK